MILTAIPWGTPGLDAFSDLLQRVAELTGLSGRGKSGCLMAAFMVVSASAL
jgi:hypothetical protein